MMNDRYLSLECDELSLFTVKQFWVAWCFSLFESVATLSAALQGIGHLVRDPPG